MVVYPFYFAAYVVVYLSSVSPDALDFQKIMISSKSFTNLKRDTQQQHHRARRSTTFSDDEISATLDLHNQLRSEVVPEASNMKYMTWDDSLATMAQQWSEGCLWDHGQPENISPFRSLGQNLWSGYGIDPTGTRATQSWYDEVQYYDYSTKACSDVCGHYTQVVWAKSYAVGCGRAFCPSTTDRRKVSNAWMITCNYGPSGNYQGQSPYKAGRSCSLCDSGVGECFNNQCRPCAEHSEACACELECQNCGVLLPNCTCECRDGWLGVDCSSPCEDTNTWCGRNGGWPGPQYCGMHASIPTECPLMCGVCRSEDPNFVCDIHSEIENGVTLQLTHDIRKWSQIKLMFRRVLEEIVTTTCNKREYFRQCCSTDAEKTTSEKLSFVDTSHVGIVSGYPKTIDSMRYSVMVYVRTPTDSELCARGDQHLRRRRESEGVYLDPAIIAAAVSENIDEIEQSLFVTVHDVFEGAVKTDPRGTPTPGPIGIPSETPKYAPGETPSETGGDDPNIDSHSTPAGDGPDHENGGASGHSSASPVGAPSETPSEIRGDDSNINSHNTPANDGPEDDGGEESGHSSAGLIILIVICVVVVIVVGLIVLARVYLKRKKNSTTNDVGSDNNKSASVI